MNAPARGCKGAKGGLNGSENGGTVDAEPLKDPFTNKVSPKKKRKIKFLKVIYQLQHQRRCTNSFLCEERVCTSPFLFAKNIEYIGGYK